MTKWVISLMFLYVVGGVICLGLLEASWYGAGNVYDLMFGWKMIDMSNPVTGFVTFFPAMWNWMLNLIGIMTWDYPYLMGPGVSLFRVCMCCISIGFLITTIWTAMTRSSPT
jgi:hypothetical protein